MRQLSLSARSLAARSLAALSLAALALCAGAAERPHLVMVIADDLGYNDIGARNGGRTLTPAIDSLIADGVSLSSYYAFKLCSPSRASLLTGRYPWGAGLYVAATAQAQRCREL